MHTDRPDTTQDLTLRQFLNIAAEHPNFTYVNLSNNFMVTWHDEAIEVKRWKK